MMWRGFPKMVVPHAELKCHARGIFPALSSLTCSALQSCDLHRSKSFCSGSSPSHVRCWWLQHELREAVPRV